MTVAFTPVRMPHHSRREEGDGVYERKQTHQSVMLTEVLEYLAPEKGEVVVDATYGAGGHSKVLKAAAKITLIAIDADPGAGVIEGNFADLKKILKREAVPKINKALFDLGWRSEQLSGKGFSFQSDEPLTMSYGKKPLSGFTAREIVNTWSEKVLADIIFGYGEERYARPIARAIIERRTVQPIETTIELAETVKDAVPSAYRHGRLHPATKTFQALRIAVNDELKAIEKGITAAWETLACGPSGQGGRIAVISFHSIEDRVVKRLFASLAKKDGRLVLKKPLIPSRVEISANPRARSAKLRVIEKICTE